MTEGIGLKLDDDEEYLRRLIALPDGQILAYGGDDGTLVSIMPSSKKGGRPTVRIIREYDEGAIRALAVSSDGRRVAVGFDNGSTRIYKYGDYNGSADHHPFAPPSKGGSNNDDDEDDNGFLSQPDLDEDEDMEDVAYAGPQMEAAVRDLKFLPNGHWLAIATEATTGLSVVNVSSTETMKDRYLETQVEKEHDGCGVRGVDITSDELQMMASLALDGRLCVWKVSDVAIAKSTTDKVPVVREAQCCVPQRDIGACGSTPADQACLPHWVKPGVLALPGKTQLQLRKVTLLNDCLVLEESKQPVNTDPSKGHIERISALASQGDFVVSSGSDGRVILWELQEDEDDLPIATYVRTLGTYESMPTSLYWQESTLFMACANGSLQVVEEVKVKSAAKNADRKETTAVSKSKAAGKTTDVPSKEFPKATPKSKPVLQKMAEKSDEDARTMVDDAGEEDVLTKSPEKNQSKRSTIKSPKIMFTESEDENPDSDKENDKDEPKSSSIEQHPMKEDKAKEGTGMNDSTSDDEDSVRPETQLPSVRSVLTTLEDSNEDTPAPAKQTPKKKSSTPLPGLSGDTDSDIDELIESTPKDKSPSSPVKPSPQRKASSLPLGLVNDEDSDIEDLLENTLNYKSSLPTKRSPKKKTTSTPMDLSNDDSDIEDTIKNKSTRRTAGVDPLDDKDTEEKQLEPEEINQKSKKKTSRLLDEREESTRKRLVKQAKSSHHDDDDDDIFDDGESTKEKPSAAKVSFIDDEAEDSNSLEDDKDETTEVGPTEDSAGTGALAQESTVTEPSQGEKGHTEGNDNGDDNGEFPIQDGDEDSTAADIDTINEAFPDSSAGAGTYNGVKATLVEPQAPFAPSSTSLDLDRRFLCWNSVGSVTLLSDEIGNRSTVDINFTDKAFKRPISFTDNMGFILGSLGDDGAIFATDLANEHDLDNVDDVMDGLSLSAQTKAALRKSQKQRMRKGSAAGRNPLGSSIYFHRFNTFASLRDKDWYLTLPDGERVLGCACGEGWAAAVTSRKFLRLFSSGGCQGQVLWLPGNPVTVVGRGRFLAVFYHESMPLQDGTQKLGCMLYDAVASRTIAKGPVCCITAGSSLSWAGFSNDFSLMAMDSDGMLSMLQATSLPSDDGGGEPASWEWSPLLDTVGLRKSSEDSFWPITVFDGKLVCIPLKGGIKYPDATRRPITATIGMKMPLARSTLAKSSALEEISVRSNMALIQKKVINDVAGGDIMGDEYEEQYHALCAQVDKVSLKLFATMVEAGKLERALDVLSRLNLEKSYDIAMAIADNHSTLVDQIEIAKENKFPPEDDEDFNEEDDQEDYDEPNDRYENVNSSPQGSHSPPSNNISPDSHQTWKTAKRSLGGVLGPNGRNVRARAF